MTVINKVVIGNSQLTTENAPGAQTENGGNVLIQGSKKVTLSDKSNVKAVGDVTLTSALNNVVVDNSTITAGKSVNISAENIAAVQNASTIDAQGDVNIYGKERAQVIDNSKVIGAKVKLASDKYVWTRGNSAIVSRSGDVDVEATNGKIVMHDTNVTANNDVNLKSLDSITSSRLEGSTYTGRNVNLTSTGESVLLTSTEQFKPAVDGAVNLKGAKNVEINSQGALNLKDKNYTLEAGENIFLTSANKGDVDIDNHVTFKGAKKVFVNSDNNLTIDADMNNIQTNLFSANDLNAKLANVGQREKGLIAKAGHDMTIETAGDLSVSSLISGNDMTLKANKILNGNPKTDKYLETEGDSSTRAYIEVGGKFTSTPDYETTKSAGYIEEGDEAYNTRHHIQYDNEGEKEEILLVNKKPANKVKPDEPVIPDNPNAGDREPVNPDEGDDSGSVTPPPTTDPDPSDPVKPDPSDPTDPDPDCKDEEGNENFNPEQQPTIPSDEGSQGGQQQGGSQQGGGDEGGGEDPSLPDIDSGDDRNPEPPEDPDNTKPSQGQDTDKNEKEDNEDLGGGETRPDLPSDSETKTPEIGSQDDKTPVNPEETSNVKYNLDNGSYIIKMEKRKI